MNRTDAQLVEEVLEGNTASFGILVHKYQGAVYGLAYYMIKSFEDAEDLAQEAFLQAYLELHQLREPSRFAGWLRRITSNICNMWLRSHRTDHVLLDAAREGRNTELASAKGEFDPAREVEREELCEAVLEAINSLSEKNRLAVTLFYMDGLSYLQISEFLEVPVTTVESRLHKARKQLKKEMMQMVEQDFSKKKLGPEFATKIAEGILEIDEPGYGFIRQGEHGKPGKPGKDDIYISPSQIRKFGLKTGDIIRGEARPPKKEEGEHYYAMLYIHTVNNEDPHKAIEVISKTKLEPEPATKIVEGALELVPYAIHGPGYGFVRQGGLGKYREYGTYVPGKDDVYVSPSQIRRFGLKTGDVIKGEARPPEEDKDEHYHAMLYIQAVNNEEPRGIAKTVEQDFSMYTLETLKNYTDGDLSLEDSRSVQKHIVECRLCRRVVEALAVGRLSSDQRVMYFLHLYEGLGIRQLAQVFDRSMGQIKARLHHLMLQMVHAVEGTLEVLESGDGIVRSGANGQEGTFDIHVSSEKIKNLGLKTGDIIKGKARLTSKHDEHYYEAIGTFTVNSGNTEE